MPLSYKKETQYGFTWTSDVRLGRHGFTKHRLYAEGDRTCVGVITREKGLYVLALAESDRKRRFGQLLKAKITAENFVCLHFHQFGFKLTRKRK